MADDLHLVAADDLHPIRPGKARTAAPRRHVAPRAAGTSVRQAVASYVLAKPEWRAYTAKRKGDYLSRFVWYAEARRWPPMQELTANHLRAFLSYLNEPGPRWGSDDPKAAQPLAQATKNYYGAVVRTFAKWAIAEGVLPEAATHNVKWPMAPKVTDSMQTLPEDDLARLLAACDTRTWHGIRDYAIVIVLFDTGVRRGELVGMTIADVDGGPLGGMRGPGSVVSGKSGTRAIGFGTQARRAIRDYLDRARYAVPTTHDALWIARDGEPLGGEGVKHMLRRLKAAAGVTGRVHPHKFRHTYATEFIKAGGNAFTLQMALGHTSPYVTQHYVRLAQADVQQAMQRLSPADALAKKRRR